MTPKLLLADDSVTIQRVIELTFADENVQVIAVGDGQEAIDRIRSDRPDIVLADIGMPERDGYEVASYVKNTPEYAHIPVLLLTGAFEPIDEGRARAVGCEGVLVKPFEPQMVITRVRELLARTAAPPPPAAPAHGSSVSRPSAAIQPAAPPAADATIRRDSGPLVKPQDSLEDYFDRLDAALASMGPAPPSPISPVAPPAETPAPIETKWASPEDVAPIIVSNSGQSISTLAPRAPEPRAPEPSAPEPDVAPAAPVALHEAFAALLEAEEGRPVAPPALAVESIPESTMEEIVRRVVERMKDDDMRRVVLDAAERLVREEIDRIKSLR